MKYLAVLASVALLSSCDSLSQFRPAPAYVAADRATFNVVAPVVRDLADDDPSNDPDLTGVNGEALLQLIESWELRLTSAEGEMEASDE